MTVEPAGALVPLDQHALVHDEAFQPGADVYVAGKPFTPHLERLTAPAGSSVAEILRELYCSGYLAAADLGRAVVYLDGRELPRTRETLDLVPSPGQMLSVIVTVHGGGGSKNPLQIILQIALIVVTAWVTGPAGALAAMGASAIVRTVAAAAMLAIGSAALNNVFGPKGKPDTQVYSLESQSNQARPRQPFALLLGKQRRAFDLISSAFTETIGDDTWVHAIYACHYGPCVVSEIKVGETNIDTFEAGEIITEQFLTPGPRNFQIYPMRVVQENYSVELDHTSPISWATHTTAVDCERVEIDLYLPSLFYKQEDDADIYLQLEFAHWGEEDWAPLTPFLVNGSAPPGADRHGVPIVAGTLYITGKTQEPIRLTVQWNAPAKGQFDIRMQRQPRPDDKAHDSIYWVCMRTIENRLPVLDEVLSCIAMKFKASADVNGSVPVVTGIIEPIVPKYDSDAEAWLGDPLVYDADNWGPSSNQAALARYLLTGYPAAKPLTADEIDASFGTQYDLIDANSFDQNVGVYVADDNTSQEQALGLLGAAGRFSAYWNGQAMCLVPDWTKVGPRQVFSSLNASGYRKKRIFPQPVHAIIVEFDNANRDGLADQVTVYAAGYDETNAELTETLELKMQCPPTRAAREGNIYLAKRNGQQISHEWTCGADALVSTLGDRVLLERKSKLFRSQARRVLMRRMGGGVVTALRLDGAVTMEDGRTYAMDARLDDSAVQGCALVNTGGQTREITFVTPRGAASTPKAGDLVIVGETDLTSLDLEIIDISPQGSDQAQISAVAYIGPQILAAWTGTAEHGDGLPVRNEVPTPLILGARGDSAGVTVWFHAEPQRESPTDHFIPRWRLHPSDANPVPRWYHMPKVPAADRHFTTPPFPDSPGDQVFLVDIEIRTVLANKKKSFPGQTTVQVQHVVQGPENQVVAGSTQQNADGVTECVLQVSVDKVVKGRVQDLVVQVRDAAGPYPGCVLAIDCAVDDGIVQLDPGIGDPELSWRPAGHALPAAQPDGFYHGFKGGEVVDCRLAWRTVDGWLSDWVVEPDIEIPPDTIPPLPAADVVAMAKGGFNLVKVTQASGQAKDFADYLYFRTTDGVVAPGATPTETRRAAKWEDAEAAPGTAYTYVVFTRDASGNVDWAAGVAAAPVTTRGIQGGDLDSTPPATPGSPASLSQTLIVGADGVPRIRLVASTPTPGDAARILWALQRDGGGFETDIADATATTTLRTWVVNVGEVCQVKFKSVNAVGTKSVAYSPTSTRTITGDTTPPGVVDVSAATGKRPADGSIVLREYVYPADADVAGVIFQSSVLGTFADAVFAGHQTYPKTTFRDERTLVIGQPLTYRVAAFDGSGNVGAWSVFGFTVAARYIDGADVDVGAINPGFHLKGNMKPGQVLEMPSGGVVPLGGTVFVTNVSDGDHVDFPVDYGAPPQIAFNLPGGLPTPAAGTIYRANPVNLTSAGCDVAILIVTPGTPVLRSIGPGSGDAAVPQPRGVQGFSVTRGALAAPYNNFYRVRLNLSFTVIDAGSGGVAVIRVYRYDGAAWTPLADLTFSAADIDSWTGNATVGFLYSGTLASGDKIGVNVLSLGDNTATCVINTFAEVFWKSRADLSPSTATPAGEEVQMIVFPPNPAA